VWALISQYFDIQEINENKTPTKLYFVTVYIHGCIFNSLT